MDLHKMISELQAEKTRLDEAIQALERLSAGQLLRRRGRPPRWISEELKHKTAAAGSENGSEDGSS